MKLAFLFYPVKDIKEAVSFYKTLGLSEVWWADESTVLMRSKGSNIRIMLEEDESENQLEASGVFQVNDVKEFYQQNSFEFVINPCDVPPGCYAAFKDNSGNVIRIVDGTKDEAFFEWLD